MREERTVFGAGDPPGMTACFDSEQPMARFVGEAAKTQAGHFDPRQGMGNKASGPQFPTDEVVAITSNVVEVFAPVFVKAYSAAVVRRLKREHDVEHLGADAANPAGLELQQPPVATEPLHGGWMVKLGAVKTNWKRRFFVATNEVRVRARADRPPPPPPPLGLSVRRRRSRASRAGTQADNFVVQYFEKEEHQDSPTRKKGVIVPCGYSVRCLKKEEEIKARGPPCCCRRAAPWWDDVKETIGSLRWCMGEAMVSLQGSRFAITRSLRPLPSARRSTASSRSSLSPTTAVARGTCAATTKTSERCGRRS